jgi:hypothetical protein
LKSPRTFDFDSHGLFENPFLYFGSLISDPKFITDPKIYMVYYLAKIIEFI